MKDILKTEDFTIPEGVTVSIKSRIIKVTGPRGELNKNIRHINMDIQLVRSPLCLTSRPIPHHIPLLVASLRVELTVRALRAVSTPLTDQEVQLHHSLCLARRPKAHRLPPNCPIFDREHDDRCHQGSSLLCSSLPFAPRARELILVPSVAYNRVSNTRCEPSTPISPSTASSVLVERAFPSETSWVRLLPPPPLALAF
jgi:hypothetical protein